MNEKFTGIIICGHGNGDSGANYYGVKECDKTRELGDLVVSIAKSKGLTLDMYDQKRNAYQDCQKGAFKLSKKYNYVFELHFNAHSNTSATGAECYVTNCETGISVEQAIMKNMGKYFKLRDNDNIFDGVKKTNFSVITTVKNMGMSGALLETCFLSNKEDMKTYEANKKKIAEGIVFGIMEGFGLTVSKPIEPTEPTRPQGVQVGDTVSINGVYTSSNSTEKLVPNVKTGKVTKIVTGAKNPYLLENGNIGWVNDACITKKPSTPSIKSVETVAQEIVKGTVNWGTGATRKRNLTEYGGEKFAADVQKRVNEILL